MSKSMVNGNTQHINKQMFYMNNVFLDEINSDMIPNPFRY